MQKLKTKIVSSKEDENLVHLNHKLDDCNEELLSLMHDHLLIEEKRFSYLYTETGAFLENANFHKLCFEAYTKNGLAKRPVRNIIFHKQVSSKTDLATLINTITKLRPVITDYFENIAVEFGANLIFAHNTDFDLLNELCEIMLANSFMFIDLIYNNEPPESVAATQLKTLLASISNSSLSNHSRVFIKNIPFCFLPPEGYKLAYRTIVEKLKIKGNINRMDHVVELLEESTHDYHETCQTCRRKQSCYQFSGIKKDSHFAPYFEASKEETIVFAGPSVNEEVRNQHQDVVFAKPAEQGDLFLSVIEGYKNVLLIDGYFFNRYPATTFELLIALQSGLNLFGSSSMGVWRALELEKYGMYGSGFVFNYFKQFEIKPYHQVAQLYNNKDEAITEPIIGIIYFIESAYSDGIISEQCKSYLINWIDDEHFSLITFPYFLKNRMAHQNFRKEMKALQLYYKAKVDVDKNAFNIKLIDAIDLLNNYKKILQSRNEDYTLKTFEKQADIDLAKIKEVYCINPGQALEQNVFDKIQAEEAIFKSAYRTEEESITLANAKQFFEPLDLMLIDLSKFDFSSMQVMNVVYVPFFFLGYGLSTATGYAFEKEKTLVSTYMELFERIPKTQELYGRFLLKKEAPHAIPIHPDDLPFSDYVPNYNRFIKMMEEDEEEYIAAHNLLQPEKKYLIPEYTITSTNSNGMASGNSFVEANIHALLEIIERDAIYDFSQKDYGPEEEAKFVVDLEKIKSEKIKSFNKVLLDLGLNLCVLHVPSKFGMPVYRVKIFNDASSTGYGGQSCGFNHEEVIYKTITEAYQSYLVTYQGGRDDKKIVPINSINHYIQSKAVLNYKATLDINSLENITHKNNLQNNPEKMLIDIIQRMKQNGIKDIYSIDISPQGAKLHVVKVIVPGTKLLREH